MIADEIRLGGQRSIRQLTASVLCKEALAILAQIREEGLPDVVLFDVPLIRGSGTSPRPNQRHVDFAIDLEDLELSLSDFCDKYIKSAMQLFAGVLGKAAFSAEELEPPSGVTFTCKEQFNGLSMRLVGHECKTVEGAKYSYFTRIYNVYQDMFEDYWVQFVLRFGVRLAEPL